MSKTIWVVGSLNVDLVQTVERLPQPGETIAGGDLQTFPGGKGANQAYAAARLGGRVHMVGNVGEDQLANLLIESLVLAGVGTAAVRRVSASTGAASIFVMPNGENAITISPGANGRLTPDDVRERLSGIAKGDLLLCQLETPVETVLESLRMGHEAGATTILDPAPASGFPQELLAYTSLVTPNETEACAVLGLDELDTSNPDALEQAAARLREMGAAGVILKMGEAGCYFSDGAASVAVPGFDVNAVDTTAAGDTFNGACAAYLAEGHTIEESLRFACAAAAVSVTKPGAQPSVPTRDEAETLCAKGTCQ